VQAWAPRTRSRARHSRARAGSRRRDHERGRVLRTVAPRSWARPACEAAPAHAAP
jgi:hypothetical protein